MDYVNKNRNDSEKHTKKKPSYEGFFFHQINYLFFAILLQYDTDPIL